MSRWYIIHAYSGFENKVKDSILAEAAAHSDAVAQRSLAVQETAKAGRPARSDRTDVMEFTSMTVSLPRQTACSNGCG